MKRGDTMSKKENPERVRTVAVVRDSSRLMVRELGLIGSLYGRILPTNTQCHILIELKRRVELQSQELANILCIDKSTLSRVLAIMVRRGWVRIRRLKTDSRSNVLVLTSKGEAELRRVNNYADNRVGSALLTLSGAEAATVAEGLELYSRALRRSRLLETTKIRPIRLSDDRAVAAIIRSVMPEFGADGKGFALHDPEVSHMSRSYRKGGCEYLVLEAEGLVLGGGGLAPLKGADPDTCEIQKMYFRPELRGLGFGRKLLERLLKDAAKLGYRQVYLETLFGMEAANHLYESLGFRDLSSPLGETGHCGCSRWMVRRLR